jgi:hypothetical protein
VQRLACLIVETHVYITSAISKVEHPLIRPILDNPDAVEHAEKPKGGGACGHLDHALNISPMNQSDSATSS